MKKNKPKGTNTRKPNRSPIRDDHQKKKLDREMKVREEKGRFNQGNNKKRPPERKAGRR